MAFNKIAIKLVQSTGEFQAQIDENSNRAGIDQDSAIVYTPSYLEELNTFPAGNVLTIRSTDSAIIAGGIFDGGGSFKADSTIGGNLILRPGNFTPSDFSSLKGVKGNEKKR